MSDSGLSKDQLRSKYLKLRKELSRDFAKKASRLVAQRMLSLEEVAITKVVSAYLAINNEVETKEIIDQLTKRRVKIFLPKYSSGSQVNTPGVGSPRRFTLKGSDSLGVRNDSGYFFAEFVSWRNLERGPFGILQPNTSGVKSNKPGLEFPYKPGLKESQSENTSGVGSPRRFTLKGFDSPEVSIDLAILPGIAFDKKGVRLGYGKGVFDRLLADSKAVKIGLAYDFQIVDELPRDKYDLVMDLVVTEKRVILC